jgi:hypothetical protein
MSFEGFLSKYKYAAHVKGDPGITLMLERLRERKMELLRRGTITDSEYRTPFGVFARCKINGQVYSILIQTLSQEETLDAYLDIQFRLQELGAKMLSLIRLPVSKIPLFPLFSVCDRIERSIAQKISANYWSGSVERTKSIETWIREFLDYRRKIVVEIIPELEPAVPFVFHRQTVFCIHDPYSNNFAVRYYRSKQDDDVRIDEISDLGRFFNIWDLFEKHFGEKLPPKEDLLQGWAFSGGPTWTVGREMGHPYFAAVRELRQYVEQFNKSIPEPYVDALYLTEAKLGFWTSSELRTIRELSDRFAEVKDHFRDFQTAVQVAHIYHLDDPKEGEIRNGSISSFYWHAPTERVITIRLGDEKDLDRVNEILGTQYGVSRENAFHARSTHILHYLQDKMGTGH